MRGEGKRLTLSVARASRGWKKVLKKASYGKLSTSVKHI